MCIAEISFRLAAATVENGQVNREQRRFDDKTCSPSREQLSNTISGLLLRSVFRTWTRVGLESRFLELGLGLEICELGLDTTGLELQPNGKP